MDAIPSIQQEGHNGPSSYLDPLETAEQVPDLPDPTHTGRPWTEFSIEPLSDGERTFRHGGWAEDRQRVWAAMCRIQVGANRLESFRQCGSGLWLYASSSDVELRCNCCHDRWCQPCQKSNAASVRKQLEPLMVRGDNRFVTLTLRHNVSSLSAQIDRLYASFKELRRRRPWKDAVRAAAAFCEIKIGRDKLWHVHLHVLTQGTWIDRAALTREWYAITGDSYILDIREVRDVEHVAGYVTKYLTKAVSADVLDDPARLDDAMAALRGRRLMATYGQWKSVRLREKPSPSATMSDAKPIGRVAGLMMDRSESTRRWREAIERKWPMLAKLFSRRPFRPPPDERSGAP